MPGENNSASQQQSADDFNEVLQAALVIAKFLQGIGYSQATVFSEGGVSFEEFYCERYFERAHDIYTFSLETSVCDRPAEVGGNDAG